jgi:serine/threonine protein kinase
MLAKNKKSGEFFAMKRLKKADIIKLRQVDHVISENTILADIDHPFLVSTYDGLTNDYYIGWAQRIFIRHKIPLLFNGVHRRW